MTIRRLPAQLANQIAAGEVVERPSSVVKELVENCLDAGATAIDIDIEKGGHKRIRIRDNGSGVAKEELELALSPHSTSKIASLDDLENIASLGFRGEALASISSVSRLTLTSKPVQQGEAWSATAQGRDMQVEIQPAAHPDGTTIDVCDLFFNTPARRKFLRAEKTEFQHIEDIVKRIALSRPRVSFTLKHNNKVIKRWQSAKRDADEHRVAQVCGKQFGELARFTSLTYDGVTLRAWVGGANLMRSATDLQFSFVNGRAMRDKLLLHAIRQAYEATLESIEQPAYVLFIDLSPGDVDVNVHPAKHEVRFQQARQIHDLVCRAFQEALVEGESVSADAICNEPVHQYSTVSPPQDYIRPLQEKPQIAVSPPTNPYVSRPSSRSGSAPVSKSATAAYTQLMSESNPGFQQFSEKGVFRVEGEYFHWVDSAAILRVWLEHKLRAATLAQPLLMPVSVALAKNAATEFTNALAQFHFVVTSEHGKCVLKQVPATVRSLPWGRIFPALVERLTALEPITFEVLSECVAMQLLETNEHVQQGLDWFMCQPSAFRHGLIERALTRVHVNDFVQRVCR